MIIGITGPSGSGKSIVCEMLGEKYGFFVIDCDKYARKAVCPEMIKKLCDAFSKDILNSDGTLNRKALASIAFKSTENTELLNKITHPYIIGLVTESIKKDGTTVLDAPTLFESGLCDICDYRIAVLSSESLRSDRLCDRDKLTAEQLADRQKAAKDDEFFKAKADKIIINNGNIDDLFSTVCETIDNLLKGQ